MRVLDPRLRRRDATSGWITEPVQRIRPVSTVRARVKFAFSSSVVHPVGSSWVVTNASPMAESMSVMRQSRVDDADRVVVVLGRLALEERVPRSASTSRKPSVSRSGVAGLLQP